MGGAFVEKADREVFFRDTLEGALKHATTNQKCVLQTVEISRVGPNLVQPQHGRIAGSSIGTPGARSVLFLQDFANPWRLVRIGKRQGKQRHGALQRQVSPVG
jgi:hypothetical protein